MIAEKIITQTIQTKMLGEVEINKNEILTFKEGILAFHEIKNYIILETPKKTSFKYLQSIHKPSIAFVILRPEDLFIQYKPQISQSALSSIELDILKNKYSIYCIITIPQNQPEKMTLNLQGPIIVNEDLKLANQFISEDKNHSVREPLLQMIEKGA